MKTIQGPVPVRDIVDDAGLRVGMEERVAEFILESGQDISLSARAFDVISEVGEVTVELRTMAESTPTDGNLMSKCTDEVGDTLFSLVALQLKLKSAFHGDSRGRESSIHPAEIPSAFPESSLRLVADLAQATGAMAKAYLIGSAYGTRELHTDDKMFREAVNHLLTLIIEISICLGVGNPDALLEKTIRKYRTRLALAGGMGSETVSTSQPPEPNNSFSLPSAPVQRTKGVDTGSGREESCELKEFAIDIAHKGGEIVRRYFRSRHGLEHKSDGSPVTLADRETEVILRNLIENRYPEHGIIGEEFGIKAPGSDSTYTWIIDPLDGTQSFISGSFDFGMLIAVAQRGKPIIGLVYQPVLGDLVIGDNMATVMNGRRVHFRACASLSDAVLLTTDWMAVERFQRSRGFLELTKRVRMCRTWGNCFGYTLLCQGFADIMIDPIMSLWDSMALIPIIRGAGGVISDYHGSDPLQSNSIVAAAPDIHEEVIQLLGYEEGLNEPLVHGVVNS